MQPVRTVPNPLSDQRTRCDSASAPLQGAPPEHIKVLDRAEPRLQDPVLPQFGAQPGVASGRSASPAYILLQAAVEVPVRTDFPPERGAVDEGH